MALIAALLSLFLDRYAESLDERRRWEWFPRYCRWFQRRFGLRGIWSLLFLLFWPLLLTTWVYQWLDDLFWLFGLGAAVAVLFYSFGPLNLLQQIETWQDMKNRGDLQGSYRLAAEIRQGEVEESEAGIEQAVMDGILLQTNERLLAVLFWFVLLGPLGALLYRMVSLTENWARRELPGSDFLQAAWHLHDILAWMPARLCAISYALSGSFIGALAHWQDRTAMIRDHYSRILLACGRGALQGEAAAGSDRVQETLSLVHRATVIWLTALALMTLAGWVR